MVEEVNKKPTGLSVDVTLPSGEKKSYTISEANTAGLPLDIVNSDTPMYAYTDDMGNLRYSPDYADLPASIKLNEDTGNIEITAPKSVMDTKAFQENFSDDQLKEYSLAYKLNPDYKISVTEKDEETGEEEEKEVTIPEYIERLNSALQKYMENLRSLHAYKKDLVKEYGEKVNNMTDEQLQMTLRYDGKSIYLPDVVFEVGQFGSKKSNIFDKLKHKITEDGLVSLDELKKIYDRDYFGREELTHLITLLDATLKGSSWNSETEYEDENGNKVKDPGSTEEMAKIIAFKNYILSNNPHSEWWQQAGDAIESAAINAAYGCTSVVGNLANIGQTVVTLGNGMEVQNALEEMDDAMSYYNMNNSLVWDGVANAQILGYLGGVAAATIALHYLGKGAVAGLSKLSSGLTVKLGAEAAAALGEGAESVAATASTTANIAKTASTLASMAMRAENVAVGTKIMLASLNLAQKVVFYTNTAITAISGLASKHIAIEFLIDTIHDAILYDSTTLRKVLIELGKDPNDANKMAALQYWMGQLAENAKWWGPVSAIRTTKKVAGKTTLGKAANVVLTKYVSKKRAAIGSKVQDIKDNFAGGNVVTKLQKELSEMKNQDSPKANRLKEKINEELNRQLLRQSLKDLGDVKLEWDGLKLTEESAEDFKNFLTQVKGYETAIDARLRAVDVQVRQMTGLVEDPSTGKMAFINPTLGGASAKVSSAYFDVADLARKYGLKATEDTLWSPDMVKYFMASQHLGVMNSIADAGGKDAAKAADAAKILEQNVQLAKNRLPDEITLKLDELLKSKVYQNYYAAQNEYGVAHKLLEKKKFEGYAQNPIWVENGYMPTLVKRDFEGRWVDSSDRIENIIEQEMDHYTYKVDLDQEYIDPELVRITRQRTMASAEISKEFWNTYNTPGSSATNITVISGAQTEYAEQMSDITKNLETIVGRQSTAAFKEAPAIGIAKPKRGRKAVKDISMGTKTRGAIVSGMNPTDINDYMLEKGILENTTSKLTDGVTRENYKEWFNSQNNSTKKYLRQQMGVGDKSIGTFDKLNKLIEYNGDEFETGMRRAYLIGDKDFAKSALAAEAARNLSNGKDAFYQGVLLARAKSKLRGMKGVDVDAFVDDAATAIEFQLESLIGKTFSTTGVEKTAALLAKKTDGAEDIARYMVLQEFMKKSNLDAAKKALNDEVHEVALAKNISTQDEAALQKQVEELFDGIIGKEYADSVAVAKTLNASLVDNKNIYDQVKGLNEKILSTEKKANKLDSDYVIFLDDEGRKAYAQVDPAFASLYKFRYKMDKGEASLIAKTNALMSKAFRYGTTSVNLASFGNQMFRDFGNAILIGGAWDTIKHNADNMADVFGRTIVDQIKQFTPDGYEGRELEKFAEGTGQTVERAAVSRELMRGAAIAPSTTETSLYRGLRKKMKDQSDEAKLQGAKTKLQELVDKWSPETWMNGKRENYLRNRVFASSLNDALTNGYTLQQSRVFAEFAMNNATTNFARKLYHMQAIADSTPYFSAAINGTKSFWRMWALDPVGISGRIMGGLIIPTMALTGASLMSEEDRKVYENIPEYSKQDSLVFVFNGNAMSIPIPQELGAVVAPFRQFVEYLHGANKNDFWELMANDLLGFSPVDLQGFTTIDYNKMISDPTFFDRVNRGFARVFSQMAPVPVKSAYMLATGTDPYTGKNLRDKSYMYWNDETNSVEVMTYEENSFAKWFADLFGDSMSPELAEKIVSGILGTTGANVLGDITALLQEGPEAAATEAGRNAIKQLTKPITVEQYNQVDSMWSQAVRQLTAEKEAILNSEKMKTLNNELSQTKDPEKIKELRAERQTLVDDYQQRVADTVKRLNSVYQGIFDRKKFGAVIQLLNFNTDASYQTGSQYSIDLSSQQFWDGRDAAIHTMERLGVTGTNDMSIFGYLATDNEGNPIVKYSSPVAIIDMKNQWENQGDIHLANIKALVSQNNLWDRHTAVENQISAIYNKGKLSNSDYDAIDAIYVNWNAEVMSALAPYIEAMTPEAAINNTKVLDYLDSLIEVPGDYKKDKNGKYVTNNKLGNGSATQAYVRNYIKNIFGANDTAYSSGRNYSTRKNYDKENSRWR